MAIILLIIIIAVLVKKNKEYKSSAYYQVTKLPYLSVKWDAGRYGEYLTYKCLKSFEANGAKFLFNVYIPKEDNQTTEVDVLMICSKGLFVFESKNYRGWIFGSETQRNWCQTLPTGRGRSHKEQFYNPIMQNRSHIKHLKAFIGEQIPMRSIIVFSDRCTLKNIRMKSKDISVVNCCNVSSVVSDICNLLSTDLLSEAEINQIYEKLLPCTQVDAAAKAQHIANIQDNLDSQHRLQESTSVSGTEYVTQPVEESKSPTAPASTSEPKEQTIAPVASEIPVVSTLEEPKIPKCPKCGSNLVLRIAKKGANMGNEFYGCSNFPKCKYIENIIKETV